MDFSDLRKLKSNNSIGKDREDEVFVDFSKRRSEGYINEGSVKNVLIIYASGSMAATKELEIERGGLHNIMSQNFYLCDLQHSKKCNPRLQYLTTPVLQTGARIQYKVAELDKIDSSINMKMENICQIAKLIAQHYEQCSAFIVVTGLDTICHVGTTLSFMLQNLSKLVICTGGYLPLTRMRNDSVSNLVECFSVVAQASTLNDVIIVSKNKGFRANRCIKMTQGDFQNISSPNLPAICSIKTKMRVRSYLFEQKPEGQFSIFTQMSRKIKVLKFNQYQCLESLQYDLKNPHIKGVVIQSYSFANIPNLPEVLQLFKQAYEDPQRKIIFINISEAICSRNQSLMKQYLQNYHVYYGYDMTCEAALAKLSYLIGKGYPEEHIIKQMQTNLRGELTEEKEKLQFKIKQLSLMQIVNEVLGQYIPASLKDFFQNKIQNNVAKYIINKCSSAEFKQIFDCTNVENKQNKAIIAKIANDHDLLHRAVAAGNIQMAEFLVTSEANINQQDQQEHSPLFYAIKSGNKPMIQLLSKNGGRVISQIQDLFQVFVQAIQKDDVQYFNLLYHIQFKQTLKSIKNGQQRTVAHIAGLLKAKKCYKLMKQKYNILLTEQDIYGLNPNHYMNGSSQ